MFTLILLYYVNTPIGRELDIKSVGTYETRSECVYAGRYIQRELVTGKLQVSKNDIEFACIENN